MTRAKIILGITVLIFAVFVGCSSSKAPPQPISDDTLYEVRIGSTVIEPEGINLIPYAKDNRISFQTLKQFSPKTFKESLSANILVRNVTQGWANTISTMDVFNNGTVFFENNEWGSLVTYQTTHALDRILVPDGMGGMAFSCGMIFPGDRVEVEVLFLRAEYADSEPFLMWDDAFTTYCASDVVNRQVGDDNIDTSGFIESLRLGNFEITDEKVNIIPLYEVNDITVDFNTQLNPYKFADLLSFRIVVNNLTQDTSYRIDAGTMRDNGQLNVVDFAEGTVRYVMDHSLTYFINGDYTYTVAEPGDVLQIWVDFFRGEDSQLEEFLIQNKRFRIFFLGSPTGPVTL